jgi:hypothetical protein
MVQPVQLTGFPKSVHSLSLIHEIFRRSFPSSGIIAATHFPLRSQSSEIPKLEERGDEAGEVMGLAAWLNLDGKDVVVFAGLAGYFVGRLMPPGWWAIYMSILVSYHLFLAWLVLTADHDAGISMPIVSTITTHLACMVVVVGLGMGRHFVPFLQRLSLWNRGSGNLRAWLAVQRQYRPL